MAAAPYPSPFITESFAHGHHCGGEWHEFSGSFESVFASKAAQDGVIEKFGMGAMRATPAGWARSAQPENAG